MGDAPRIVPLGNKDEMQAALEALRRILPQLVEQASLVAQFRRSYYLALVKEGFSEQQALELCKHSISL